MNNIKKMSVTIGIPAYNEEQNIGLMLESVMKQERDLFTLDRIVVITDGCTDMTADKVIEKSKVYPLITLINDKKRLGKVKRLTQIYQLNESDVLITLDADIILGNPKALEMMINIIASDKTARLVVGHHVPVKPKTFVGKIIFSSYQLWDEIRLSIKNYDHVYNCFGAAMALTKSFANSLRFPSDVTDDEGFLYISAKNDNGFRYAVNSLIYYRPVSTLEDLWMMSDRSLSKNEQILAKHFGNYVYDLFSISFKIKLKAIFARLIKDPFYTSLALFVNVLWRVLPIKHDKLYDSGMWEITKSTKEAIILEDIK